MRPPVEQDSATSVARVAADRLVEAAEHKIERVVVDMGMVVEYFHRIELGPALQEAMPNAPFGELESRCPLQH
jgi:hypothetical protein